MQAKLINGEIKTKAPALKKLRVSHGDFGAALGRALEAEQLRAGIDQRARMPMTLLSPQASASNITPMRQEVRAG